MSDLNLVVMIGRLTRDAEIKTASNGKNFCTFSIAVNGYSDEVSFFDVTAWEKLAENLTQYLTKGKQINIEGRLKQDRYELEGNKKTRIYIIANKIQLLGSKKQEDKSHPDAPADFAEQVAKEHVKDDMERMGVNVDDDVPF